MSHFISFSTFISLFVAIFICHASKLRTHYKNLGILFLILTMMLADYGELIDKRLTIATVLIHVFWGPFTFFYIKRSYDGKVSTASRHFILPILLIGYTAFIFLTYRFIDYPGSFIEKSFIVLFLIACGTLLFYFIRSIELMISNSRTNLRRSSQLLNWSIVASIFVVFSVQLIRVISISTGYIYQNKDHIGTLSFIPLGILAILITYFLFYSGWYLKAPIRSLQANENGSLNKLIKALEIDKVHLDAELNLLRLSTYLGFSSHKLSMLINSHFGVNYSELINSYRAKESANLIRSKGSFLSFLAIAYESGFKSKSVFNRSFKNEFGVTPSQFFKKEKR